MGKNTSCSRLFFLRVIAAQIIALIWTVPVGVAIGMNKKLANILQPIIQVVASIPATALFPVILVYFMNTLGGLKCCISDFNANGNSMVYII